jgi:hypothetical protein
MRTMNGADVDLAVAEMLRVLTRSRSFSAGKVVADVGDEPDFSQMPVGVFGAFGMGCERPDFYHGQV